MSVHDFANDLSPDAPVRSPDGAKTGASLIENKGPGRHKISAAKLSEEDNRINEPGENGLIDYLGVILATSGSTDDAKDDRSVAFAPVAHNFGVVRSLRW